MRRFFLSFWLLEKRFFKNPMFLLLLLAIPLLALGLMAVSQEESGILKIALCAEDPGDSLAEGFIRALTEDDSPLLFVVMEDAVEARAAVEKNQVDAAWIFAEGFQEKLQFFARNGYSPEPAVLVVEREDTIPLQLSKIKLFGALYPDVAYSAYRSFAKEALLPDEELSEEDLRLAYEGSAMNGNLFQLDYVDFPAKTENRSYIMAPLRGLLALMVLLCGFSAVMLFFRDKKQGMFARIPAMAAQMRVYAYVLAATGPAAAVSLTAFAATKNTATFWWECLTMAVFVLSCCTFCALMMRILRTANVLGACLPFLMLGMLVFCPIFFSYGGFRAIQLLLPPYYYLNAIHNVGYLYAMCLYAAITGAASGLCAGPCRGRCR